MPERRLIIPKYMIPVRPRKAVLENHGVLVEGERIAAILPSDEARTAYADAEIVELDKHVLLPGLINMHTHSPMTLLRGVADDLEMQVWLNEHIWPAENRLVDKKFVADGTRLAMAEMIRGGTTCFNDSYFFPDEMARVAVAAGMRGVIGLPLLDQPTCWAGNFDEYHSRALEVLDRFGNESLLKFTLAPHAPYSVSDTGLATIASTARKEDLRIHLHCLETAYDLEQSLAKYDVGPLDRLERAGLFNERLIAVHMTQLDENAITRVADHGVHIVHCPQSNLKLASGICPIPALLQAGVNVCIGTDGAASNNNLDLLEEVRFAAMLAKGVSGDAKVLDAVTAVDMMTINGASALGMEAEIGTLEVGKKADLCVLDLSAPQTQPLHDLFSTVTYAASSAQFSDVWVSGRRLMRDGALLTLDHRAIRGSAEDWRVRMTAPAPVREAVS